MSSYRICCFGDSNTFGYIPGTGGRLEYHERWPGALAGLLGEPFEIVEEGKNGRTTIFDDGLRSGRNGIKYLPKMLARWAPIDLLIIMLGTNDLKAQFEVLSQDVAGGIRQLCDEAKQITEKHRGTPASLLVVCPPKYVDCLGLAKIFKTKIVASRLLAQEYESVCRDVGAEFFDANSVIASSSIDGVHIDREQHHQLAEALCVKVREIYSREGSR